MNISDAVAMGKKLPRLPSTLRRLIHCCATPPSMTAAFKGAVSVKFGTYSNATKTLSLSAEAACDDFAQAMEFVEAQARRYYAAPGIHHCLLYAHISAPGVDEQGRASLQQVVLKRSGGRHDGAWGSAHKDAA